MLDFLDDPRKSLWNIGSGLAEGDFSKALPGLLGAGAAGLTAATGFGLPFAALAGSAVGGLSQNLFGKEAQSPDDLVRSMGGDPDSVSGQIGSLGLGLAGDPLSLAGAGMGRAGAKLGGGAGRSLEAGAIQRGPRYGTTVDDLLKTFPATEDASMAAQTLNEFRGTPQLSSMLREIPEGSSYLGSGAEGTAFKTPAGDVSRFGLTMSQHARPIDQMLLQPTRTVAAESGVFSKGSPVMLHSERVPFAQSVGKPKEIMAAGGDRLTRNATVEKQWQDWTKQLQDEASMRQLNVDDLNSRNWGVHQGKPVIIDPGSVDPRSSFAGGFNPLIDSSQQPGMIKNALLSMLGSDAKMRAALAEGRGSVDFAPQLERLFGGSGAALGLGTNALQRGNQ